MDQSATEASDPSPPISHLVAKYPFDAPLVALDGADLRLLVYAAYEWLAAHYELVNRLNVFPVKDGDTGTNLLLTMKAAWAAAVAQSGQSAVDGHGGQAAGRVLQAAAEGALHGSRGNSGVIFSQFLRGVSQILVDQERLMTGNLAKALPRGAEVAFQSVPSPVEGTILTVMREVGQAAVRMAASTLDLRTFFAELVVVADGAVRRTPEQLAVLKQAGVVDSGGKGLFFILEGMYRALMGVTAPTAELFNLAEAPAPPLIRKGQRRLPKVQWGFDVQCLIEGPTQPLAVIRQTVAAMGDYPLVEGDESLVKVHVHVFDPGTPLSYAVQIGFVTDVVVENMDDMAATYDSQQAATLELAAPDQSEGALVDGIGLVAVTPGAGFADIFREIGVGAVVAGGETMNPSTAELLAGVESLPNQRILILPNNSNVLLAAQQAAELAQPSRQVLVVPTKTLPEGIAAALAATPNGDDLAKTVAQLQERIAQIDTGEVAQAVRHAEFDGVTVEVGDYIGLHNGRLVTSAHTPEAVALALLEQMAADESDLITFYYGAQIAVEAAENLKEMVCNRYPDQDVELAFGGQENYHYILSTE